MMFQNRDEAELKFILDKFVSAFNVQNETAISFEEIRNTAVTILQIKVNDVLENRLTDFSIPELIKIINFSCRILEDEKIAKEETKKQEAKKTQKKQLQ